MINYIEELKTDFYVMKELPKKEFWEYVKNRYKVMLISIWYSIKKAIVIFAVLTAFIFAIHFIIKNTGGWWR